MCLVPAAISPPYVPTTVVAWCSLQPERPHPTTQLAEYQGWCSSSRELGSVMHELGHLLGTLLAKKLIHLHAGVCRGDGVARASDCRGEGGRVSNLLFYLTKRESSHCVTVRLLAAGMEHEQKRPDSQKKYFGKGPYLVTWLVCSLPAMFIDFTGNRITPELSYKVMKWENVAPGWEYQWEVDSIPCCS